MINILCFGDSNTHGTQPMASIDDRSRWSAGERWPGVVQAALGPGYHIIEEGLPGRTTVFDDPIEGAHKNGRRYLAACLESHWQLDIVVLMLGVNDLKARFGLTPFDIAMGMGALAADVKSVTGASGKAADVLILAAPPIRTTGWTAPSGHGMPPSASEPPRNRACCRCAPRSRVAVVQALKRIIRYPTLYPPRHLARWLGSVLRPASTAFCRGTDRPLSA